MAGVTLFIGLLVLATLANGSSLGVPLVSIVLPIKPRSVEIQAQMIQNNLGHHSYVPCIGHVVQYKFPAETTWNFANVAVLEDGKFILDSLQPGQTYQVRVACKDEKKSVGPFTDPIKVETPLRLTTPGNGGNEEVTTPPNDDDKAGNSGISLSSSTSFHCIWISLMLGLMISHSRQSG